MVSDSGISPTVCINHAAATPAASAGTVCEGVPVRYSQGPLWPRAAIAKGSGVARIVGEGKKRGPKIGGSAPFGVGAGSPSNTKSPWLKHTSIPSGILMHPAVWPH